MIEALIAAILILSTAETPIGTAPEKLAAYKAGVESLAAIIVEVGKQGLLVSPEVDPALLSAVAWYESRYRPDSPDGDCRETGLGGEYVRVCAATGPMQMVKSSGQYLVQIDPSFKGVKAKELSDPKVNVRAGYAALRLWKQLCGGTPAVWLTAYVWGKCPKHPDWEGVRRCALATAMLDKLGQKPEGWKCGHEAQRVEAHTRFLVRKLRKSTPCSSPSACSPATAAPPTSTTP